MSNCKVLNCRFPNSHVTQGHKCGICSDYGHGQMEHGNIRLLNKLKSHTEVMPDWATCTKRGCKFKNLHNSEAHHCHLCNKLHSWHNCQNNKHFLDRKSKEVGLNLNDTKTSDKLINIKCPLCNTINKVNINEHKLFGIENKCVVCMHNNVNILLPQCKHVVLCDICCNEIEKSNVNADDNTPFICVCPGDDNIDNKMDEIFLKKARGKDGKIYIIVYAGMGCCWYVRRDGIGEIVEYRFVHSDDGYSAETTNAHNKFIEGYTLIE